MVQAMCVVSMRCHRVPCSVGCAQRLEELIVCCSRSPSDSDSPNVSAHAGGTKYPNRFEYLWLLAGICGVGMTVFLQALHYPRTVFELAVDLLTKGRWPSYYKVSISGPEASETKTNAACPQESGKSAGNGGKESSLPVNTTTHVNDIIGGRRVTDDGKEEFLLETKVRTGEKTTRWAARENLCVDGTGPAYAERGALYAGSSGGNSTRARIETYKSLVFAQERLAMDVAR